jgi:ubiquinone/menaquinone biosynthesis C-methylase UbiE
MAKSEGCVAPALGAGALHETANPSAPLFANSAAYDRFMGRWSGLVGAVFLDWIYGVNSDDWLDVGCGTGSFTRCIANRSSSTLLTAIDSEPAQIEYAKLWNSHDRIRYQVADVQRLPFPRGSFDVVTSALVLNFVPKLDQALHEMGRVARHGGTVAGYVWDFENDLSPTGPFRAGMKRFGLQVGDIPGKDRSSLPSLHSWFERAGFRHIETRSIDIAVGFESFDSFWRAQTSNHGPLGHAINKLPDKRRVAFAEKLRLELVPNDRGKISYVARANAIKAVRAG